MDWHAIFSQALQQGLGPVAGVYCLAAIGLNVHFGYTGLLNFGQAGFMAVAGYAVASFVATWGLSFWLGTLVGLLSAAVLALLLGVPTLRLRADYLAIVTIAAAEIIRQTIGSVTLLEYFGGQDGLQGFNRSFADLNPFSGRVGIPGVVTWRPYDFWTLLVVLGARRGLLPHRVGRSCAARGAGCSRASARTRTRSAASARTSTPTRCSRWSSAA